LGRKDESSRIEGGIFSIENFLKKYYAKNLKRSN